MNIQAKFVVSEVRKTEYGTEEVKMRAVCDDGCPENKKFSSATPSGSVEMTVSNKAAHGAFVPGKAYIAEFVPAAE